MRLRAMSYRASFRVVARKVIVPTAASVSRRCWGEYPTQNGAVYGTSARSAARRATSRAVIVSVPSGRCAPCCSQEPIGIRTMSDRSWNHAMSGGARSSRQLEKGRASSGMGGLLDQGQVAVRYELGEVGVVHVGVDPLEGDVRPERVAKRVHEGGVGLRVPQVAALRIR